jgi:type IV secretory pathway VirB3-like protein
MLLLFFKLAVLHCLCDYPLQGDFLSKAKNHTAPIPGVPWYQALMAHAVIQGGAVWLVTGSLWLAAIEIVLHAVTDYLKCANRISFNTDQAIHLLCKIAYVFALNGFVSA